MKLWQKNTDANQAVDRFTVGHDREMDLFLAEADVLGSLAHTRMLNSIGLLGDEDLQAVQRELKKIHADIVAGRFTIDEGIEDVHSQVEFLLTERIGDAGKKIHSGRSRNDQVLVTCGFSCAVKSRRSSRAWRACSACCKAFPTDTTRC